MIFAVLDVQVFVAESNF